MLIADLVRLHDKVKVLYRVQITREERLKIQGWRQWVEDAWTTFPRKVYNGLKTRGPHLREKSTSGQKKMRANGPGYS